jgi:CheY-like chemotaxis protein
MLGNLWLARADLGPDHPVAQRLEPVWTGALRGRDLVRQILTFSRRSTQQRRPIDLPPVLQESLSMLRATLPSSVALDVMVEGERLVVEGDETQMQQIVMNLCTNAWQALPGARGRIQVSLRRVRVGHGEAAGPPVPIPGLPPGEYVLLSVGDDGAGMDESVRARIFEPFFTTKPPGQGTGLGLSVVHGIVLAHHGTIGVSSSPGAGSRFDIALPALQVDTTAPAAAAPAPQPGRGERVLYVDDDEVMVAMVRTLLDRAGYQVTGVHDAVEAVDLVRQSPRAFDLVVTDHNMPAMTGVEVVQAVRGLRSDMPVIVSTGHVDERLAASAISAGAHALLYKENSFDELAGMVRRVLDGERPLASADPLAFRSSAGR